MTEKEKITVLEKKINQYFTLCDTLNEEKRMASKMSKDDGKPMKPYTMSGLLCYIGLSYREFEILREKRKYRTLFNGAKSKIEAYIEEKSLTGELSCNASQTSLKYYFGWGERQDFHDAETPKSTVVTVVLGDEARDLGQ